MDHRTKTMEAWQRYRTAEGDRLTAVQHNRDTLGPKAIWQAIGGAVSGVIAVVLFILGFLAYSPGELGLILVTVSLIGAAGAGVIAIYLLVEQSENRRKVASDCAEIPQQRLRILLDAVADEMRGAGYTITGVDYEKKMLTTSEGNITLGQESGGDNLLILLNGKRVMHSYSADRDAATDIDGKPIIVRSGIADTI